MHFYLNIDNSFILFLLCKMAAIRYCQIFYTPKLSTAISGLRYPESEKIGFYKFVFVDVNATVQF